MSGMTLSVDDNLVRPVIEKEIQAAIVRELGKSETIISEVVRKVLEIKVNSEGKPSGYSSDKSYIEWVFQNAIMEATREAMKQWISENQPAIQAELQKQFTKSRGEFSSAIIGQLIRAVDSHWQFKVEIALPK